MLLIPGIQNYTFQFATIRCVVTYVLDFFKEYKDREDEIKKKADVIREADYYFNFSNDIYADERTIGNPFKLLKYQDKDLKDFYDDFDADKCLINIKDTELPKSSYRDGKYYTPKRNFVLAELTQDMTDNEILEILKQDKIVCLRVSDFNTTGLRGIKNDRRRKF